MDKSDAIWTAAAIAEALGTTEKRAFNLLESGALKEAGAKKVGGRWVVSRTKLEGFIQGDGGQP